MIVLKSLSKDYGAKRKSVRALDDINLTINKGEIYGIIGHSGAGKSTLIRCINLLERPTQGTVEMDGVKLTELTVSELQEQRRKIGMIFQHFNLLTSATVFENIAFPLKLARKSSSEIEKRVSELLQLVGLADHRDKFPAQLSGGQKQRVGIARALANNPTVLLCDEATSALDPQTTNAILALLLDINQKLGLTIVLITHEMQVIRSICDRVAVIDGGRIVESGQVVDVFLNPAQPVTREFVEQVSDSAELGDVLGREKKAGTHQVMRVTFLGEITYEPILFETMRELGTSFSILQGTISRMKSTPYGQLIVKVQGNEAQVRQAVETLRIRGLDAEVI
ncbi:methionine ABC transporter ATP-binding protein [Paenibacillus swuensis]|uniref:Methionine ABC transporter ATP-binding protein n=1 Tax=Paenibacillus swuensis TaxID=1178515 RepID=A0A172TJ50_9BACL|nr:methionine ABC transporter ATP-binding protein [Paenibacillus swuensis]ANE46992.1 methionine ABC transporter ATP-binding protein [Paenibacillus swuensis]